MSESHRAHTTKIRPVLGLNHAVLRDAHGQPATRHFARQPRAEGLLRHNFKLHVILATCIWHYIRQSNKVH